MRRTKKPRQKVTIDVFSRQMRQQKTIYFQDTKVNQVELNWNEFAKPQYNCIFATSIHAFLGVLFSWFSAFTKDDWLVSIQCLLDSIACTKCSIAHNSNDFGDLVYFLS